MYSLHILRTQRSSVGDRQEPFFGVPLREPSLACWPLLSLLSPAVSHPPSVHSQQRTSLLSLAHPCCLSILGGRDGACGRLLSENSYSAQRICWSDWLEGTGLHLTTPSIPRRSTQCGQRETAVDMGDHGTSGSWLWRGSGRGKEARGSWVMCCTLHHSPSRIQLRGWVGPAGGQTSMNTHTDLRIFPRPTHTLTLTFYTPTTFLTHTNPHHTTNTPTYNICIPYRSSLPIWILSTHRPLFFV